MSLKSAIRSAILPFANPLTKKLLNTTTVPRTIETNDLRLKLQGAAYVRSQYKELIPENMAKSVINNQEFGVYSQHGEDGILLFIFSKIGVTNRLFVEFGVEDGTECNTANLSINFGFGGLLLDGSADCIAAGRIFYDAVLGERSGDVKLKQSWVTRENINTTFREANITGEIDLLSIDVDGNDYWIWESIDAISPRLVVVEYNAALGPTESLTIPYKSDFYRWAEHPSGLYYGASLSALASLGTKKGYKLIGCDSCGANAFFLRKDLQENPFPELSPQQAHYHLTSSALRGLSPEKQYAIIKSGEWVAV